MVTDGARDVRIPPGTVLLEKYRVSRTLGVGGMGVVVLAEHATLGTRVAIKFLLPQFAAVSGAARRFLQEAKAASRITSEHIVRVFDTGTVEPYGPYIIMEYLEGRDLGRELKERGGFGVEEVVDYGVQAALALSEAHNAGVVHRDVKPANLYVIQRSDGSACIKVLDFGISKVVEDTPLDTTNTSTILGSALYMSPEQMRSAKNVDHRTDVYALGVSMFEMLAATPPYKAESFSELVMKVNLEPPAELSAFRADVPSELAAVLARAYAKRPDDRYQTMAELAAALRPWASHETRQTIDTIARVDARRRPGSLPSLPPPPASVGAALAPEALPQPVSESGAQSNAGSMHPWGRTHVGSSSPPRDGGTKWLVGVGVALGVALSLGAVGLYVTRSGNELASAQSVDEQAAGSAPVVEARAQDAEGAAPSVTAVVPEASASAAPDAPPQPAAAAPRPSAPAAAASASAAPAASASPPAASAAPTQKAPCYVQDADGSLRPCD